MIFLIDLTLVRSFIKSKNFASPSRGFQVNDLSEKHFQNKDKMNGETTQGTLYGVEFNPSLVYLMEGGGGGLSAISLSCCTVFVSASPVQCNRVICFSVAQM